MLNELVLIPINKLLQFITSQFTSTWKHTNDGSWVWIPHTHTLCNESQAELYTECSNTASVLLSLRKYEKGSFSASVGTMH